jgi:2-dehydropantoate 2-reductase
MRPRLVFVGAGAIGGYVGGHLARLGHDVTLIDPWPAHVEAIRARGLMLTGMTEAETITVRVPAMHVTELQGMARQPHGFDIAFISVKSYDSEWATAMIAPYLAEGGFVVSLQNCINEPALAGVVGWDRTVGMIASTLSAELHAPGEVARTGPLGSGGRTVFYVGEVHGRITPRVRAIGDWVAAIDSVEVTTNLWGERWTKLCVNAMRNGISAATGLSGNEFDQNERIRRFSFRIGAEAVRIGQALGYALGPVLTIPPETLARAGEGERAALEAAESAVLKLLHDGARSARQRPSMGQDMKKGRRTEIDFINGHVVQRGAEIGWAAPANAALVAAVKRVERGEVPARPENITGINI